MQTTFPGRPVQEVICSQHLTNNMHDYNLTKNNDEKNNNNKKKSTARLELWSLLNDLTINSIFSPIVCWRSS